MTGRGRALALAVLFDVFVVVDAFPDAFPDAFLDAAPVGLVTLR
jgi:hypothetical protein